ncbi:MAG: hypothetical protein DYG88_08615 [Chloroflexi bacterium CFX4]|nr:hypothetical protein [Chloroflexi bacterium CFX4]MDL1922324.1 hypothetical protein [Chloroflexi bacterium CFX3]
MMNGVSRKSVVFGLIVALVAGLLAMNVSAPAMAQDGGNVKRPGVSPDYSGLLPELAADDLWVQANGRTRIIVEMSQPPTALAFGMMADGASVDAVAANMSAAVEAEQTLATNFMANLPGNVRVLNTLRAAVNAIVVEVDAANVNALRQIPGVKNLYPDSIVERANADAATRIVAPPVWQSGYTGAGIRVGVIDDGLDYRHAHFGGTPAATWGSFTGPLAAKVVGGFDFVGDAYDARDPLSVPAPDPDPLTCWPSPTYPIGFGGETSPVHHGTHVAGSLIGYGVASDGSTYLGPYDTTTPLGTMRIGPGIAPLAQLYVYRVFGCYGSTATVNVVAAIDRSVDPNGDFSPADRLDVINMSLGSNYGSGLGIYEAAINNATTAGVVVVASAGNGGDSFFVTGSPAAASSAISVANTSLFAPVFTLNAPFSKTYPAFGAAFGPQVFSVTGNIVLADPILACGTGPLTNASAIAGNIALIDRGTCPFVEKVKRAQDSGAIAALVCSVTGAAVTMGGSDPTITIPSIQLEGPACSEFRTLSGINGTMSVSTQDGLNSSSSRGPRRGTNISPMVLKPDVAAPGTNILSSVGPALPGPAFNQSARYSGTSMAAPMVAGMAAALRQKYPTWTPAQIKALIMNTADADVFVQPGILPDIFGVGRAGSGRANLSKAEQAPAIAYDSAAPERVSVSFGLLEVVGSGVYSRTITVKNMSAVPQTYAVSVQNIVNQNGTTVSASPSNIVVPVAGTATVTVTITANPVTPGSLNRDPSTPAVQAGVRREWLPEVNGNVLLTPASGPVLRVPYHAAVRPVSTMKADSSHLVLPSTSGTANLSQSGTTFSTGSLIATGFEFNAEAMVSPFRLMYQSPNEPNVLGAPENHADIRYVGVTSDYGARSGNLGTTQIYFAIVPWSNVTTPKEVEYAVYIDVDQNGIDDYILWNARFSVSNVQVDFHGSNLGVAGGIGVAPVGIQDFVNPLEFADPLGPVQTYKFLNNTYVMGVAAGGAGASPFGGGGLKLTPGQPFNFRVEAFSYEYFEVIDSTPYMTYNPTADIFDFTGASAGGPFTGVPWYFARPTDQIPVDYNLANYVPGSGIARILLLYYHNASSFGRAQVIDVSGPGLPNPLTGDTIGVRRDSNLTFYLRSSLSSGPANYLGVMGASGIIALAGDWNGDGTDTPGIYDPSTGFVALSNSINGAPPYIEFAFGLGGDYPIVGDWNGDGIDTMGVYRQSTGQLLLRNDNSTGFADFDMIFGDPGDIPFAGDWDGNGADSPGVFRPSTSIMYLLNSVTNGIVFADESVAFGSSGDEPVAGDWDGNGITDLGIYRPSMGMFFLRMPDTTTTGGGHYVLPIAYGMPGDFGLAGRWFPPQPDAPNAPEVAPTFVPRQ